MSVIVILGMHKSGTTLIAETLHRSGIPMIGSEADGGYDDGNKMERLETRALNMALLGDQGTKSLRLIRPVVSATATPAQLNEARRLAGTLGSGGWGFKDPRTLLTFDFWEEVLEAPKLVGIFRDPVEVFSHYLRRAGRRWISRDPTFLADALRAWCVYNERLVEVKRRHPDLLLLNYAEFMTTDVGMQKLSEFLKIDLVDCRDPAMRREEGKRTADYRLARHIVRLRDGLDPDRIAEKLHKAVERQS